MKWGNGKICLTPPSDHARKLLHYDPETGIFSFTDNHPQKKFRGKPAGYIGGDGYLFLTVSHRSYRAGRLAWWFVTGEWPDCHIDHINCAKLDNRFANLRKATPSENCCNRRFRKGPLPRGVRQDGNNRFVSQIKKNRKSIYLGTFETAELAHNAYLQARSRLHGEFARAA